MSQRSVTRNKRMHLRLTMAEKELFQKKASRAFRGNATQMVVYAVGMLDEDRLKKKFKLISRFSESCNRILVELRKSGNNINQVAHQMNAMMKVYEGKPQYAPVKDCLDGLVYPILNNHNETLLHLEADFSEALNELMSTP